MADFSSTEKINASWKHLFGILGTSNESPGKNWYEETLAATHTILPQDIWADTVLIAGTRPQAITNCGVTIENRTDSASITLVSTGSDWNITCSFEPKVGYQITNIHPNPTYIKSIILVSNNGGGTYTIRLNNNTGVSAGNAILHRRIFLTVDPSSNGLAWFGREKFGDSFSNPLLNFIQPQRFGNGYTVRVYKADGTELLTTQGAWIFNWQKGCLLFAKGMTPANLGYAQPIYIEGFRYIGAFGTVGSELTPGELHDTLRFDGSKYVPNSSLKADGTDVYIGNKATISGTIVLPSGIIPSSISAPGIVGEFRWAENFLYVKTELGWTRTDLRYF